MILIAGKLLGVAALMLACHAFNEMNKEWHYPNAGSTESVSKMDNEIKSYMARREEYKPKLERL
jgi:hypothetical protein